MIYRSYIAGRVCDAQCLKTGFSFFISNGADLAVGAVGAVETAKQRQHLLPLAQKGYYLLCTLLGAAGGGSLLALFKAAANAAIAAFTLVVLFQGLPAARVANLVSATE